MAVIRIEVKGLDKLSKVIDPKKIERATVTAMNTMIKSTKTETSRVARKEIGWRILKKDFDRRLDVRTVRNIKQPAKLTPTRLRTPGNPRDSFPLTMFKPKEVRRSSRGVLVRQSVRGGLTQKRQKRSKAAGGVSVQVLKGGKVTRFGNAFIATTRSGHTAVFRRLPGRKTATGKDKLREIKVVSVVKIFQTIQPHLVSYIKQNWNKVYMGRLRRFFPDVRP